MKEWNNMRRLLAILALGALLVPVSCGKSTKTTDGEESGEQPTEMVDAGTEGAEGEEGPTEPTPAEVAEEAARAKELEDQFGSVMYQRRLSQANALRDSGQLEQALAAVEDALNYQRTNEAELLRDGIRRDLGLRGGEVGTIASEEVERYKVQLEEQKVTVRRFLATAKREMDSQDWDAARRNYENAAFIVTTSRFAPMGGDGELTSLGDEAKTGLAELERLQAQAESEREAEDTRKALAELAKQEEQALLEARDRRARLVSAAIDQFNLERFDEAIEYANQVLAEEPDNRLAKDIVVKSRKAKYEYVKRSLLEEQKNKFRAWQIDIEKTKIPQSKILQWPSQSFWDKITKIRAVRSVGGASLERSQEEQDVLNTLKTRQVSLEFDAAAFPQVVEYLVAASGVNFVIDARARESLEAAEITIKVRDVSVENGLELVMMQASAEGEVVYEVVGNIVRFINKEDQKKNLVLQIHPVADLTLPLTDFIPPLITQVGVSEDDEAPLFGGQAEEAPQPYGTIEELAELVQTSVAPETWEEARITPQGKNLVVYHSPEIQQQVADFLDDLRAFAGIVITVESRFLSVTDAFLRDVGVDFRGLGGTNGGPLAVLDDVTSGLDDNASAAIDNSGPGVNAGGAALAPSSGLFFNDGSDGDFRGRTENIFSNPLGQLLTALGGGTFQVTFIDDLSFSVILRATEKSARIRELTAPSLTVYNTQRANLTVVNQISFVQDFDVEVAQTSFIADPVIGVVQDGLTLDVRPTVSNDRQYITMELRPTVAELQTPIATFQTLLGAAVGGVFSAQNPVTIQLPEIDLRVAESTIRMPDRGSVLLGGLKDIDIEDQKAQTPVLGDIPLLGFLFKRQGKSEEVEHLMIIITATITDLADDAERLRGS
ncbi:MAG: hypothetical protein AAGD14_02945 [Planctomycetota bacterium]